MKDRAFMMVYGDGIFLCVEFFGIVPEIPSPKHHGIEEFGQNDHISAMKINKLFVF
jgi:hypothetical protein